MLLLSCSLGHRTNPSLLRLISFYARLFDGFVLVGGMVQGATPTRFLAVGRCSGATPARTEYCLGYSLPRGRLSKLVGSTLRLKIQDSLSLMHRFFSFTFYVDAPMSWFIFLACHCYASLDYL
uniref:Uncharacterized protein n=1 Tax=Triticum urartu TaxID=4572 RepID=A0A8R7TH25_TRIUA